MFAFVLFMVCARSLALPQNTRPVYDLNQAEELFEKFIVDFDKHYASEVEKQTRFEIFKDKLRYINERNTDPTETAEFGITVFTDIHNDELAEYNGFKIDLIPEDVMNNIVNVSGSVYGKLPDNFDWRDHGAVTPVKNQGHCGASWAFSTTGSIEGAYAIKHKHLLNVSEQQLIDCSTENKGCKGGTIVEAFRYLLSAVNSDTEESYPYEGIQKQCRSKSAKIGVTISSFSRLIFIYADEYLIRQALMRHGPISIGIDATDLVHHKGPGIIKKCQGKALNHNVLLTGFGTAADGTKYWTIKNSYGTSIGDGGFQSFTRGGDACGILLNQNACAPDVIG